MASAKFLEDALSTNVDESAVNAILGTLEHQLVSSSPSTYSQNSAVYSNLVQNSYVPQEVNTNVLQIFSADSNSNGVKAFSSVNSFIPTSLQSLPAVTSNRITFPVQNGAVSIGDQQLLHSASLSGTATSVGNNTITMQPPIVIKQGTSTGQVGIQPGLVSVPMSVNSSIPASIQNVMTLTKSAGQNVVSSNQNITGTGQPTIIPNVQILNMRPGTPNVAAQKSVATVSPRVVIGAPQVVGARQAAPGITLQTLQGLQPGQQGHLLLKTENGQYQLLRVGPAPAASTLTAPHAQTIRLSTVPAHPGVQTLSTSVPVAAPMPTALAPSTSNVPTMAMPTVAAPPPPQAPNVTTQKPSDNTKEKCRNFLANLLDLSSKEPKSVEINVRTLIQELIDAQVEPKEFCDRLERLLNASPQPCLIGFLQKSLPLLRQSLVTKELVIEGINAPAPHVAFSNVPVPQQTILAPNVQMTHCGMVNGNPPTLTTLMPPMMQTLGVPTSVYTQQGKLNYIPISASQLPPPPQRIGQQQQQQPPPQQQHKPATQKQNSIAVLQNIPIQQKKLNVNMMNVKGGKGGHRPSTATGLSTVITPGKSLLKEKEKKAQAQFSSQQFSDDKMAGDDDINDVAAMGGVNLAEESQRILGSTELIGTQIRSCKDEYLIPSHILQARIRAVAARHGLDEPSLEVAGIFSHAVQERIKNLVEKLAVIAQHRIDLFIKTDQRYDVTQDVKSQLKFLEELDRVEKKRREDSEREILLRAAKSRSKNEDPEQAKLKAKAKEMQRAELEELRQREANLTALQAIGPRKKPRLDGPGGSGDAVSNGSSSNTSGLTGRSQIALRSRLKRINQRDLVFLMEQEKETSHSTSLYRYYLK